MAEQGNGLAWAGSVEQAKDQARKQDKLVLLDFSAAPM